MPQVSFLACFSFPPPVCPAGTRPDSAAIRLRAYLNQSEKCLLFGYYSNF